MQFSIKDYWRIIRATRDKYLAETDKTQLADFPITTQLRSIYREYRQYLRDLPRLFDDGTVSKAKVKNFEEWREWKRGSSEY